MPLAKDLLHPFPEEEKRKHKKKCLVQSPISYFMDVKCPGCYKITTVFSLAQTGGAPQPPDRPCSGRDRVRSPNPPDGPCSVSDRGQHPNPPIGPTLSVTEGGIETS
ncbi:40S ribosomal protein S27 [Myotis davidii]|uniref:40S ribosomal protein S27 n=1 Tax=Myotis davidii TaxID=225400 RepID=L5M253_MYODS|nr:40S ribosomal protein S27 [Myotis davidii]